MTIPSETTLNSFLTSPHQPIGWYVPKKKKILKKFLPPSPYSSSEEEIDVSTESEYFTRLEDVQLLFSFMY